MLFRILQLRCGFNEGYPCGSLGVNLHLLIMRFRLEAGIIGKEGGSYPGEKELYDGIVRFAFSFG